jgi:hypothetical protein
MPRPHMLITGGVGNGRKRGWNLAAVLSREIYPLELQWVSAKVHIRLLSRVEDCGDRIGRNDQTTIYVMDGFPLTSNSGKGYIS